MKFKIIKALIKTIEQGKQNAGNKYVEVEVMEDSMFAEQSHIKTYFVPQTQIPAWENAIATGAYPPVFFEYDIVEVPAYRAKKGDTVYPTVHTTMRLLVRTDEKGNPIEDARAKAEEILNSGTMCIRVQTSTAPANMPPIQPPVTQEPPFGGAPVVQQPPFVVQQQPPFVQQ